MVTIGSLYTSVVIIRKKNKRNLAASILSLLLANCCHVAPSAAVIACTIAH
jgi:hypothetical protein